ncbi:hypothetical protein QFZ48_004003 [Chitinophaga sp. W2I13]|uniref:hypothetical protein n=1 Tax=Chitinophaga sp. W2I13 TaxID=3373923 RepID=UPI003D1DEE7E
MKHLVLFISLLLAGCLTYGQKPVELDLSNKIGSDKTIGLKTTGIKLLNMSLQYNYKIKITVREEADNASQNGGEMGSDACHEANPKFVGFLVSLQNEKDEAKVKDLIDSVNKVLKDLKTSDCKNTLQKEADAVIEKTKREYSFESLTANFTLKNNQDIIVTIEAYSADGTKADKAWQFILRTPRSVSYLTHFGFTFSPNLIKGPDQFFSKASGKSILSPTTDSFTIKRKSNNGTDFWKDLSITANFIMPVKFNRKQEQPNMFNFAWSAGFGVGGDARFTVFTGPTLLVSDFFAVSLAGGVSYAYKLKGEYEEGQGLMQSLDFDQLHDRGIRPNILLSFSFRLSKDELSKAVEKIGGK